MRTRSPCLAVVGHVEVAAGVEGQGVGIVQPGEGGGGRGAPRRELAHRAIAVPSSWPRRGCRWSRRPGRRDRFSPVRVAVGVVLPGRTRSPCHCLGVGHVEVAAGVEGQGVGTVQPGEGGGGRGAPRCELAHRVVAVASWPRRGCRWSRRPGRQGLAQPGEGGGGRGAPRGELAHRALPLSVGHVEVAAGVEGQGVGITQPGEGGGGRGAPRANSLTVLCHCSWRT